MTINNAMNINQVRMYRGTNRPNSWGPIPDNVKNAFLNRVYRVVTVPAYTLLWKFTGYNLNVARGNFSPWWCTMRPFLENDMGLREILAEAAYNGISFQTYVRTAAAVRYDWNTLTMLRVVRLREDAKGLWGQFAPQPKISHGTTVAQQNDLNQESPFIPDTLGGLGAWQLWIPNLSLDNTTYVFNSADVATIATYLGVALPAQNQYF